MKFFSKEMYLKHKRCRWDYDHHWQIRNWADVSDGREVVNGYVNHRAVSDSWCVEISDDLLKMFDKQMFDVAKLVHDLEGKDTKRHNSQNPCPYPDYQIVITCHEDTTYADMFVNGHKVKEAKAKRNPADKFNWRIGAQMAFNRLWEKKKKPVKPKSKYAQLFEEKMTEWANEEVKRIFHRFDKLPPVVREVKRLAKPGEWVKIVKKSSEENEDYKIGDVLQIVHSTIGKTGHAYYKDMKTKFLYEYEYVVLEGYKPE